MRTTFIILCFFISNLFFAQNFAYANRDSILISAPKYLDNIKALNTKKENYAKEIESDQKSLQTEYTNLVAKYKPETGENIDAIKTRMSAPDQKSLEKLIDNSKKVDDKEKKINELLQLDYDKNIAPVLSGIDTIIKAYTQKNKIDILYDINSLSPSLIYINTSKNITKKIIEEIKKANF